MKWHTFAESSRNSLPLWYLFILRCKQMQSQAAGEVSPMFLFLDLNEQSQFSELARGEQCVKGEILRA